MSADLICILFSYLRATLSLFQYLLGLMLFVAFVVILLLLLLLTGVRSASADAGDAVVHERNAEEAEEVTQEDRPTQQEDDEVIGFDVVGGVETKFHDAPNEATGYDVVEVPEDVPLRFRAGIVIVVVANVALLVLLTAGRRLAKFSASISMLLLLCHRRDGADDRSRRTQQQEADDCRQTDD